MFDSTFEKYSSDDIREAGLALLKMADAATGGQSTTMFLQSMTAALFTGTWDSFAIGTRDQIQSIRGALLLEEGVNPTNVHKEHADAFIAVYDENMPILNRILDR